MLALFPRCRSDSQKKRGGVFPHCLTPSFISSHRFLLTLSLSNFEPTIAARQVRIEKKARKSKAKRTSQAHRRNVQDVRLL
jgi:hypothetical protein